MGWRGWGEGWGSGIGGRVEGLWSGMNENGRGTAVSEQTNLV